MHHISGRVLWWNIKSPRWLSPTTAQIWSPVTSVLSPKLKSPLKGEWFQTMMRSRKIQQGSWWILGELCEVPRCLLWKGLRRHRPMYNVSCILFNKCLFFILHGWIHSGQTSCCWKVIIFFAFLDIFIDYAITVVPFPPLHSTPSCLLHSHPPYSSCPWVILISSLASTFPTLFLPSPCLFSTYHLCYLFSVPFPPLSPSHSPIDNPPCELRFRGSVPVLVVCLVCFCFCFRCGC